MILLRRPTTGETQLVESADGHDDWDVVAEDVQAPPHPYHVLDGTTFVEDFTDLDTALLAKIDKEAGEFRSQFITSIPGQETTYILKEGEALAWDDATSDPADFPYLREEAAAKGISIGQLVGIVLATATAWRALNPKIEANRTAAKDAVLAATTIADKHAAAQVNWAGLLQV
ncbi:MAG: hypothetical protein AAGB23_05185 [Pseudomonadota bacterium]